MESYIAELVRSLGIRIWCTANLRSELKELIAMHSSMSRHGGDLKADTVTIIGATLDLQEKVVKHVRFYPPSVDVKCS